MFTKLTSLPTTNADEDDDKAFANTVDVRKTDPLFKARVDILASKKGACTFELLEDRKGKKHSAYGMYVRGNKSLLENKGVSPDDTVVVRIIFKPRKRPHPKDGSLDYPWVDAVVTA